MYILLEELVCMIYKYLHNDKLLCVLKDMYVRCDSFKPYLKIAKLPKNSLILEESQICQDPYTVRLWNWMCPSWYVRPPIAS